VSAYPSRIAVDEAIALIRETAHSHRTETESLAFNRAGGRVLADAVRAPIDLPSFDNSRMDGVAFAHASLRNGGPTWLRLVGEQYAGVARELRVGPGECVRITTGAPLPEGTDTVAIRENVVERDGGIEVTAGLLAGADVRRIGEDVLAGTEVLRRGQVLTPARIGLAAALGLASLTVAKRPTVAVFTTGDELVEPGMPLLPGQVYNSNRDLLMGLLRAEGLEPTAWPTLPDDPERMQVMLADAASAFDVVITSGGVSAGQKDHLSGLLDSHGRIVFWKVRMKPGMPVLFGQWDRALFLCLPGNPVSTLATFLTLGRTLLDGLQGRGDPRPAWQARMGAAWRKEHARLEFLRGQLAPDGTGGLRVVPNAADASHQLRAAADSNALILLPEGPRDYAEGDIVDVLPY